MEKEIVPATVCLIAVPLIDHFEYMVTTARLGDDRKSIKTNMERFLVNRFCDEYPGFKIMFTSCSWHELPYKIHDLERDFCRATHFAKRAKDGKIG